jgi:hypothetical protein
MGIAKIVVGLALAGLLGAAGCKHAGSEAQPATVKEQLDSQGGATATPAPETKAEGKAEAKPDEAKPDEAKPDEAKPDEAKPPADEKE